MPLDANGNWVDVSAGQNQGGGANQGALPWWQDPNSKPPGTPAGTTWPPPLPPGASYGPNPGQIIYGSGAGAFSPAPVTGGQPASTTLAGLTPSAPATTTTGTGSGSGGGTGVGPFTEGFTPPPNINLGGPTGLEFIPPTPTFTPPTFTPPSYADAASDPGYQFSLGQGSQAMQQSAAAQGVLNTGGTLKDLLNYGQAAGATQYNNVFNRDLQTYGTQFQNAQAAFAPVLTGYQTMAAAGQRANEDQWQQAFNKWLQDFNINQGNTGNALKIAGAT